MKTSTKIFIKIPLLSYTTLCFLVGFGFLIAPLDAQAAEIRLYSHESKVRTGENFLVDVIVQSDEPINAVEGRLNFPPDLLSLKEIKDGNSTINFWVERPHAETPGVILFSGITPGGFVGVNNVIFSAIFEAKNVGVSSLGLGNIKLLLNDGLGTLAPISIHDTAISISVGDDSSEAESEFDDNEPPEDFSVFVENDQSIFDGKYFLVFATQDKKSGIANYKVREGQFGWFKIVESPYVLKNQSLDKKIFIKALDRAGNERLVVLEAKNKPRWYKHPLFIVILLIILFFCLTKFLFRKK